MRVAITGASGLIGTEVARQLRAAGRRVTALVRRPAEPGRDEVPWDPAGDSDPAVLAGMDAVVHLAGESVAGGRWTAARKRRIHDSRIVGTRNLSAALGQLSTPPRVLVCASAVGFYGERGADVLTEECGAGEGFLADVCQEWEAATQAAAAAGMRVVHVRIGMVLAANGGALPRMMTPMRWGLGGVVGPGTQYMSWITLHDVARVFVRAIDDETLAGPVNATAPTPVTNAAFTAELGRVLQRPTLLRVPAFAVRLLFGEMGEELLLASTRAVPARLQAAGFEFEQPELGPALRAAAACRRREESSRKE